MQRISTGNQHLDEVTCGGLPRSSITILLGQPGSGKTLVAEQLAFANATAERPALFLTTLSEPMSKVLTFLQEFSFADTTRIGTEVVYEDLADAIRDGVEALPELIRGYIERYSPGIIIIDSFKAIADLASDRVVWRQAVFDLASLLSAYDATTLWVGEYTPEMIERVEFAVADVILELHREQVGARDDRYLRIAKLRGSDFTPGRHAFVVTKNGLRLFPRLVTPTVPARRDLTSETLESGIEGFDELFSTGLVRGTTTLLAGPSGAGKTIMSLHFLRQGVLDGEPALLVNFQENPAQLKRVMRSLGWSPEEILGKDKLEIIYHSPVELHVDSIVDDIFDRIDSQGVTRIVIDALGDLERNAHDPKRFADYVYSLCQYFCARQVTAFLNLELIGLPRPESPLGWRVAHMADNLVLLSMHFEEQLIRQIRVAKSRASSHDMRRYHLQISDRGMKLG